MPVRVGNFLARLRANVTGATAIEYGLIAALIALTLVGVLTSIGDHVLAYFMQANSGFGNP